LLRRLDHLHGWILPGPMIFLLVGGSTPFSRRGEVAERLKAAVC
jgi:hypothetical protein